MKQISDEIEQPITPTFESGSTKVYTAAGVGAVAFTANSKNAAMTSTLPAGGYTIQVSGVGATSGAIK